MLFIISIFGIIIDQLTKYWAVKNLKGNEPVIIIENYLEFRYVENYGAAFGILQDKRIFFIIITLIVIVGIIFFITKYLHILTKPMIISLMMFLSGAIGNFIDRVKLGYVVDFISVKLPGGYKFPVFNIADSLIVISTIFIIIFILSDNYEN